MKQINKTKIINNSSSSSYGTNFHTLNETLQIGKMMLMFLAHHVCVAI